MKILYVVSRPLEINTSSSIRNRATIMGLVECGHNVDLITTQPDYNHLAYDDSITLENVNIKYLKLGGMQSAARVGRRFKALEPLKRLAVKIMNSHNIYDNLQGIVKYSNEIDVEKYDLIISSSDPKSSHLFVDKAIKNRHFRGKWIQIWGDPFLADITLSAKSKKKDIYREEERLLSLCDKVVYVSKMTLEAQKKLYPNCKNKMVYVPIPYLREIIQPIRDYDSISEIKLAYCGDYNSNVRNILPLYNAVLHSNERLELFVCGNSDLRLESSNNIKIMGRQSYETVERIESEADILVHVSNLSGSQIPGKIYQYSGTNKPILFILDGETDKLKKQFDKYKRYYFTLNKETSIESTIKRIIKERPLCNPVPDFSRNRIAKEVISGGVIAHGKK